MLYIRTHGDYGKGMKNAKRIGPKMEMARDYVARHGECLMIDVAKHVHPLPRAFASSCAFGYNVVHRAIAAGLIKFTGATDARGHKTLTVCA